MTILIFLCFWQALHEIVCSRDEVCVDAFEALVMATQIDSPSAQFKRVHALLTMLDPFMCLFDSNQSNHHLLHHTELLPCLSLISNNIQNPPSLPELAQSVNFHRTFFTQVQTSVQRIAKALYFAQAYCVSKAAFTYRRYARKRLLSMWAFVIFFTFLVHLKKKQVCRLQCLGENTE